MESYATQVVVNIETMEVISKVTVPYSGPWELCKGGQSKAAAAAAQKQADFNNQQFQQFLNQGAQEHALQQGQLNKVNAAIDPILANGGMTPEAEAALRSIALNTLPQQYNNLYGALNNQLVQRGVTGGTNAGSGDIARNYGWLGSEMAGQQANLLSQIPLQKEAGLYNALNAALGVGNTYGQNLGLFTGAGSSALGQANQSLGIRQNAAQSADAASTGFWGSVIGGGLGLVKPR